MIFTTGRLVAGCWAWWELQSAQECTAARCASIVSENMRCCTAMPAPTTALLPTHSKTPASPLPPTVCTTPSTTFWRSYMAHQLKRYSSPKTIRFCLFGCSFLPKIDWKRLWTIWDWIDLLRKCWQRCNWVSFIGGIDRTSCRKMPPSAARSRKTRWMANLAATTHPRDNERRFLRCRQWLLQSRSFRGLIFKSTAVESNGPFVTKTDRIINKIKMCGSVQGSWSHIPFCSPPVLQNANACLPVR